MPHRDLPASPRFLRLQRLPASTNGSTRSLCELIARIDRELSLAAAEGGMAILRANEELRAELRKKSGEHGGILARAPEPLALELLDGIGMDLIQLRCRDWAQLRYLAEKLGGAPMELIAIAEGVEPTTSAPYRELGTILQGVEFIVQLPVMLQRHRHYLPEREMHECNVSEVDVLQRHATTELRMLLSKLASRWRGMLAEAPELPSHRALHALTTELRSRALQELDTLLDEFHDPFTIAQKSLFTGLFSRLLRRS